MEALQVRKQEAEVIEVEQRAKRARLENETLELEIEERRLILAERRAAFERNS